MGISAWIRLRNTPYGDSRRSDGCFEGLNRLFTIMGIFRTEFLEGLLEGKPKIQIKDGIWCDQPRGVFADVQFHISSFKSLCELFFMLIKHMLHLKGYLCNCARLVARPSQFLGLYLLSLLI